MGDKLLRLTMENLGQLGGGVVPEVWSDAIRQAVRDCLDRPGDKRARKVVLQMCIVPVATVVGNTIDCSGAKGTVQCRTKIPDRESQEFDFGVQNSGDLIFNPDSPRDHRQMTMLEGEGE